jgi:hypothetical protein
LRLRDAVVKSTLRPQQRTFGCGAILVDKGHVWTVPAVQEESDFSAKRSGAAMYTASHDGISVKS